MVGYVMQQVKQLWKYTSSGTVFWHCLQCCRQYHRCGASINTCVCAIMKNAVAVWRCR